MLLGLRILSQRTIVLAGHFLPLIALGLGFWLVWAVKDNPNTYQLVALGLYATFALLLILIRRGK